MSEKCKKCHGAGQILRGFKRETDGKFVEIVEPCSLCHAKRSPLLAKVMGFAALALVACDGSGPAPYTWGDMAAQLSSDYCSARVGCRQIAESDRELCYRHNYSHICGLYDTCFEVVGEEAEAVSVACSEAMAGLDELGCFNLLIGTLPGECSAVFDWQPG